MTSNRWVRLNALGRKSYPSLEWGRAYRVVEEGGTLRPFGFWIAAPGDPFLSPDRLFVFKDHFEEAEPPVPDVRK